MLDSGSAETARSNELGAHELLRLEPWATGCGSSSCELVRGNLSLMTELRLLPTGVFVREIHTPSTSIPLWIARMPNGISSLASSLTWVTGCASSISGDCALLPLSTLLYLRSFLLSKASLMKPMKMVKTMPQARTWGQRVSVSLAEAVWSHSQKSSSATTPSW